MERNSIGIEINEKLIPIIKEKLGFGIEQRLIDDKSDTLTVINRGDSLNMSANQIFATITGIRLHAIVMQRTIHVRPRIFRDSLK